MAFLSTPSCISFEEIQLDAEELSGLAKLAAVPADTATKVSDFPRIET